MGVFNLTFNTLRIANVLRLPLFKNKHGGWAHTKRDGSDWSLGEWMNAALGKLGEAANLIKKILRGDLTIEGARPLLAKELADVVTYIDILAMQLGIDLGEAIAEKFNEISNRVGAPVDIESSPIRSRSPLTGAMQIDLSSATIHGIPIETEETARHHAEAIFANRAA